MSSPTYLMSAGSLTLHDSSNYSSSMTPSTSTSSTTLESPINGSVIVRLFEFNLPALTNEVPLLVRTSGDSSLSHASRAISELTNEELNTKVEDIDNIFNEVITSR